MDGGTDVPEVTRIHDDFNVFVFSSDRPENGDGIVLRGVVDEDVLVLVFADANHDLTDLVVEVEDI
jgi:hypothetical protein